MGVEAKIDLDVSPLQSALKAVQQSFMDIASASGTMAGKVSAAFDKITNDVQKSSQQQGGGKGPIKLLEVFKSLKDEIKKVSDSKFSIPSITGLLQNENMTKSLIGAFQGLGRSLQTVTYILRGQFSSALNTGSRAMALIGADALVLIGGLTIAIGSFLAFAAVVTGVAFAVNRFGEEAYRAMEVGMSASQLKPIELAFEKVGGKASDAVPALQSFITKLSEARFGSGEAATALRQLSIASGKDLRPIELLKKGNKQALLEVLDALKQVRNEAQRGQIASTLFTGKSGAEIKAIVDTGSLGDAESMLGNVNAITEAWGGTFMNIKSAISDTFTAIKEGVYVVLASFGTMFNMSAKIFKEWQMGKTIANIFADIAMFIGAIGMVLDPIIGLFSMLVGIILRMVEAVAYLFAVLGRGIALLMSTLHYRDW